MNRPPFLKKGDKIGILSTARKVTEEELKPAIRTCESWGLNVILSKNLFQSEHQYSGTDQQRTQDFQSMIEDDSVKAVISARGGYGTLRIIDHIDFTKFKKSPKWICGYSDITVLHSQIHQLGIETIHSTMPISFSKDATSVESLRKALFGELHEYSFENNHDLSVKGETQGVLLGGNLSLIYAMQGSKSDIDTQNKILFIEDLDEYLYHVDRMMLSLSRSGKLKNVAGLIVGGMTEMKDNAIPYGKSSSEIIMEHISKSNSTKNIPVCFDFPAGHDIKNMALYLGREIKLKVNDKISIHF